ncbi:MAG: polyphosphate--glucose phosphotransferase [Acidimicrobiales bacterium]
MTVRMGIDIGGTGIKGAPVDLATGALVAERRRVATPRGASPADVVGVVRDVVASFSTDGPIGIAFPGVVIDGITLTAANVGPDWVGLDAAARFAGALERPVRVMNDADAAGVAEMRFGAGRGHDGVVVMLTFGTGIGSAVFHRGVLVPNTELGHLELGGRDAEASASGTARDRDGLSWEAWAARVERYLRHVDSLLWPDLFIVGGGMSKEADRWLPSVSVRCPVVPAALRNHAGIVGAAVLADAGPPGTAHPGAVRPVGVQPVAVQPGVAQIQPSCSAQR